MYACLSLFLSVCVALPHRHVEGVDDGVAGAVDGPFGVEAGDVKQGAIGELMGPVHFQGCFADGAGSAVQQLGEKKPHTHSHSMAL